MSCALGTFSSSKGSLWLFLRNRVHGPADPLHPGARTLPISGRTHGLAAGAGCGEAAAVGGARPGFATTKCVQSETGHLELHTHLQQEVHYIQHPTTFLRESVAVWTLHACIIFSVLLKTVCKFKCGWCVSQYVRLPLSTCKGRAQGQFGAAQEPAQDFAAGGEEPSWGGAQGGGAWQEHADGSAASEERGAPYSKRGKEEKGGIFTSCESLTCFQSMTADTSAFKP